MNILKSIQNYSDFKSLPKSDLKNLCSDLRNYFIETILDSGGHFAGNLGVVELTVALEYIFDLNMDRIVWDVGHQTYIHKMLTGRKNDLHSVRSFNGISGFPKLDESIFDHFGTGHSSTSVSAALGIAAAFQLQQITHKSIAVVGDGALTGGMTFEALNNVVTLNPNLLIVLNDNHMGIDPNIGAIDRHLVEIEKSKENIFTNFGIPYSGPIDGHDLDALLQAFEIAKGKKGTSLIHVKTIKGKGYAPAEMEQTKWHSTNKYVKINTNTTTLLPKWQDVFAETMLELAEKYINILGITPAMPSGSGMIKLMEKYPNRFFDVGIAEQHAVTFSAGLATQGFVPFLNIYSTFLQRGYDQLIHDVALQKLPVVFCIDRAGLVGEDGPTHHGTFDISFLKPIPNLTITAPKDATEFRNLLFTAYKSGRPFCIRYPKGECSTPQSNSEFEIIENKAICIANGDKLAILSTGIASDFALSAVNLCKHNPSIYHFPFIKPLDELGVLGIFEKYTKIITIEDSSLIGGFGESIKVLASNNRFEGEIISLGIKDDFVTHGANEYLYDLNDYSPSKIVHSINLLLS